MGCGSVGPDSSVEVTLQKALSSHTEQFKETQVKSLIGRTGHTYFGFSDLGIKSV